MNGIIDIIFKIVAIFGLGAGAVGFIASKTDAVKYDPQPIIERMGKLETTNAVQDTQIGTMGKDITEIKSDVKEIKQMFYEDRGFLTPAKSEPLNIGKPQNPKDILLPPDNKISDIGARMIAPLIKGVKKNGEPENEK